MLSALSLKKIDLFGIFKKQKVFLASFGTEFVYCDSMHAYVKGGLNTETGCHWVNCKAQLGS